MAEDAERTANERVVVPYAPFPPFSDWATRDLSTDAFDRFVELLDVTKREVSDASLVRAVQTATKWAAVDTGAIEGLYEVDRGFTMSVAVGAIAWENLHERIGPEAERTIHDALAGYEYVLDAATAAAPITEVWIKELHAMLCASQETYRVITDQGPQDQELPKGVYKLHANNPLNLSSNEIHSYAPVADTAPEMGRLVSELRSEAFAAAHPVVQAAYAHYAFVCVHPFADGNGRVSRALASVFLYRRPGIPLVIFADQKPDYLDALELADAGEPAGFLNFVADRAVDTIEMVRVNMKRPERPSIQERLQKFTPILTGRGGLSHAEIDAIGLRLIGEMNKRIVEVLAQNPMQQPWQAGYGQTTTRITMPGGYRAVPGGSMSTVTVSVAAPGAAQDSFNLAVGISLPDEEGPDFVIYTEGENLVEAFLREVHPTVGRALQYRIDVVLEDHLGLAVDRAAEKSRKVLEKAGYRPTS